MNNRFRENSPKRNFQGSYKNYRSYKPHLAEDFFNRCGYTDCLDFWFGGKVSFHIDHFIPWKTYPDQPTLKTDYQNLVYCCSYVNILKSNDEGNYLDPCNEDFNQHFFRDGLGNIQPNPESPRAQYMYKKLRLFLRRYQLIWLLDNIRTRIGLLDVKIEETDNVEKKTELLAAAGELAIEMARYINYLQKNQ